MFQIEILETLENLELKLFVGLPKISFESLENIEIRLDFQIFKPEPWKI